MSNRINLGVGAFGQPDNGKTPRKLPKGQRPNTQITLQQAIQFVRGKNLPPEQEEKLIQAASARPNGALYQFVKNWKKYLR